MENKSEIEALYHAFERGKIPDSPGDEVRHCSEEFLNALLQDFHAYYLACILDDDMPEEAPACLQEMIGQYARLRNEPRLFKDPASGQQFLSKIKTLLEHTNGILAFHKKTVQEEKEVDSLNYSTKPWTSHLLNGAPHSGTGVTLGPNVMSLQVLPPALSKLAMMWEEKDAELDATIPQALPKPPGVFEPEKSSKFVWDLRIEKRRHETKQLYVDTEKMKPVNPGYPVGMNAKLAEHNEFIASVLETGGRLSQRRYLTEAIYRLRVRRSKQRRK